MTGANIYVNGEDPVIQADDHYPDWLWSLTQPRKSAKQLRQQADSAGGYDAMPADDFFRLDKLERKAAIKARNLANRKR